MDNNKKELTRPVEGVAPWGWREYADEVRENYDPFRKAKKDMERAKRVIRDGEFPPASEIRVTNAS